MRSYSILALGAAVLLTAGCDFHVGDDGAEVSFSENEVADRFSIVSRDDKVKLALTDEGIYFALSDEVRQEVEEDLAEDMEDAEGLEGAIISVVARGVSKALAATVSFDLERVRDIRWEDGELVLELEDGPADLDDFEVDGQDLADAFHEDDVRQFAREFERLKTGG